MVVEQYAIKALEGAKAQVTFQISGDNTANEYQKVFKKYSKSIELKGFRKGKVPIDLLERKFGKEFRRETFQEIFKYCINEILPKLETKPLPYSNPYLCNQDGKELVDNEANSLIVNLQPGNHLEFAIGFDTMPEIPLPSLENIVLENFEAELSEDDVNQEIEKLRKQNGIMVAKKDEQGKKGDILSVRFALLEEGKAELDDNKKGLVAIVRIGEQDVYGFHDKIKHMKEGENQILYDHSFSDSDEMDAELRAKNGNVWIEISSIRSTELPDLDDDFAQDIDENYKTLDDLRKAIRDKLEHSLIHAVENYSLFQIYQSWIEHLEFDIPQVMVVQQTQSMLEHIKKNVGGNEQAMFMYLGMQHNGDVRKGMQTLEKDAVLKIFISLVRDKLLASKAWEASHDDIDNELAHMAQHQSTTVESIKDKYSDQWSQVCEHFAQMALSSRLTREVIAEAKTNSKAESPSLVKFTISELNEKLNILEKTCQELAYEKFSPLQ